MRYRGPVCVARIQKPYGNKGEMLVVPENDFPEKLKEYATFYVFAKGAKRKLHIQSVKKRGGYRYLFKFKEISSQEKAESVKGHYLFVDRENLLEEKTDGYYIFDLIGMSVVDRNKNFQGYLNNVIKGGAYDYLIIINEKSGKEIILPEVTNFVKRINITDEFIEVDIPEGLLED